MTPRRKLPMLPETRRRAILGRFNGRSLDQPEPGFFRLRMVKGGVMVPASIWAPCPMVLPGLPAEPNTSMTACDCGAGFGVPHAVDCSCSAVEFLNHWCMPQERRAQWPNWTLMAEINGEAADPLFVWERGQRIAAQQYRRLVKLREYAQTHAPHQPEANPRERLDLRLQPSLF